MKKEPHHLIIDSLEREHVRVRYLLEDLKLNLNRTYNQCNSQQTLLCIRGILDHLHHHFCGLHCRKEDIIFKALREMDNGKLDQGLKPARDVTRIQAFLITANFQLNLADERNEIFRLASLYSLETILCKHIEIQEKIWFPHVREHFSHQDWYQVEPKIHKLIREFNHARSNHPRYLPCVSSIVGNGD